MSMIMEGTHIKGKPHANGVTVVHAATHGEHSQDVHIFVKAGAELSVAVVHHCNKK